MTLARGEGVALWRQICQRIGDEIHAGAYAPGVRLPTESNLAQRFAVNRHTIRRAIGALEDSGLVRAEQVRGTFVNENIVDDQIGKRTRFRETLERQDRASDRELLNNQILEANAALASTLRIRIGDLVEVIELLGRADQRPISVAAHHFPAARFRGIGDRWLEYRSITDAVRDIGVEDYIRESTRVTARPAESNERNLLELPRWRPVLVAESVNAELDGTRIEYGLTRFAADRVQLVFAPDSGH